MRQIKFRGKRKNGVEILFGDLVKTCGGGPSIFPDDTELLTFHSPDWFEVEPDTIGQYTGMEDANGNPIYEHDTLKWISSNPFSLGETRTAKVSYVQARFWCSGDRFGCSLADLLSSDKVEIVKTSLI